ncbi:transposase [Streptomyces sp. NPDC005071]
MSYTLEQGLAAESELDGPGAARDLLAHFLCIPDSRQVAWVEHPLPLVLALAAGAVVAGIRSFTAIARERAGRAEDPSLVVLDAQPVHAAVNLHASTTGKDAGKKVPGRKHGIAVDVKGLIIAVVVMAASVHDNAIGTALLDKVATTTSTVSKALVDQGFKSTVVEHGREIGIDVEIVERNPADTGFVPQPIRWRVEQTLGTLMLHRRLTRDYEGNPRSSESRILWVISSIMIRRLTGTSALTWRGL